MYSRGSLGQLCIRGVLRDRLLDIRQALMASLRDMALMASSRDMMWFYVGCFTYVRRSWPP
eukprot:597536-Amorphochlora_amoeboformis.AAC.1